MNRRALLQTIAAIPLCGWVKPKKQVDDLGGFVVPKEFAAAIESGAMIASTTNYLVPLKPMTLNQVALARNVYMTPELAEDEDVKARIMKAALKRLLQEEFRDA
jgi:hypothetical protein